MAICEIIRTGHNQIPSSKVTRRDYSLRLSHTKLHLFEFCPWAYHLRYDKKIRPPYRPHLLAGAVVHNVIAEFLIRVRDNLSTDLSDLDAIFENRWRRVRVLDSDRTVNRRAVTLKLVREYWKTNQADFGRPLKLEERFRLDLGDVQLEGIVDRVEDLGSGEVEVIDYKSGAAPPGNPAENSLQLSIYALACQEAWGLSPTTVSFYFLTGNSTRTASITNRQIEATKKVISSTAARIRTMDFPPNVDSHCNDCDFLQQCSYGLSWARENGLPSST